MRVTTSLELLSVNVHAAGSQQALVMMWNVLSYVGSGESWVGGGWIGRGWQERGTAVVGGGSSEGLPPTRGEQEGEQEGEKRNGDIKGMGT